MATDSNIEWTEFTWNPVTGCIKISQGCKHCYAERMAKRLKAMGAQRYADGFRPTLHWDLIDAPRAWRKPRLIFVNSMSDLFQDAVPEEFIFRVWATMAATPHHTYQILTKRPARMAAISDDLPMLQNVWLGTSVENGEVIERLDDLRATRAAIRF